MIQEVRGDKEGPRIKAMINLWRIMVVDRAIRGGRGKRASRRTGVLNVAPVLQDHRTRDRPWPNLAVLFNLQAIVISSRAMLVRRLNLLPFSWLTLLVWICPCDSYGQRTTSRSRDTGLGSSLGSCNNDRRGFLQQALGPALLTTTTMLTVRQQPAHATIMSSRDTPFTPGELLSYDQALVRFQQGRDSLDYLMTHYADIQAQGGGDNVRRYLGTVGTSSGLYGISKVMRSLQAQADDNLVEFTEAMTEIEQAIQQADGSAYMAIFVTTSTSGVPPEKYFNDALLEIKRAAKGMTDMADVLGMDETKH